MAAPPLNPLWLDDAFKSARDDFKKSLKNPALYDFSRINTIDDVLEEATKIEKQQAKTKTLRGLTRINPFVNGLKEYAAVVEVFVQAKPDVLSLIWAPLKFILQASSSVISAFEKVVKVIADLGITLPSFKIYAQLFQSNHEIRRALCLFYADIMDFYAVLLNFLANRRLNVFLESLWPNIRSSITTIQENMEHHKTMMTMNVTLEDILQAYRARRLALEEHEHAQVFRDSQTFTTIRNELHPHDYDVDLADILRRSSVSSGQWLRNEPEFMRWLDPTDRTVRHMWLHGIPGCGKTFLTSNIIKQMQDSAQRVLFVFLCHDNKAAGNATRVFHSILFQLLEGDISGRPILHEASKTDSRKLRSDADFVRDLLCKILKDLGPSYITLDGVDELEEHIRKHLLSGILHITDVCPETKLLISSREERDISLQLSKGARIRVDHKNFDDIVSFVQLEREGLIQEMKSYGADRQTLSRAEEMLGAIADKAEGMFIYARLVLHMVQDQGTLHDIEEQIENLPDGLDEAYGRLLARIKSKLTPTLRTTVRTILQWVACAQRPLREEEILQILAIEPGKPDFTKGRKEYRDICKACGPIIEINESTVRFVHFSAKEYLLHEQSGKFLDLSEAHVSATLVCTTYLAFSSLDMLFSQPPLVPDIRQQVENGDYVMFEYASMAFMEHLKLSLDSQDSGIETGLNQMRQKRRHTPIDNTRIPSHLPHMFRRFADQPELMAFILAVECSETKARLGLHDQDELMDCSTNDPMNIFYARRRFRQTLENMICRESGHTSDCRCELLRRMYGTKIYHCDQRFCYAYRNAFESHLERDQHLEIHQRPHKCCEVGCLFGEIGFRDITELQRHVSTAHSSLAPGEESDNLMTVTRPLTNKFEALIDAIVLGSTESVKTLFTLCSQRHQRHALYLACWKGSSDILSILLDQSRCCDNDAAMANALAVALEGTNLPNIKLLLSRGADMSIRTTLPSYDREGVGDFAKIKHQTPRKAYGESSFDTYSGYTRALSQWDPHLINYLVDECQVTFPISLPDSHNIFRLPAIGTATLEEARERLNEIRKYIIWPEAYTNGITAGVNSRNGIVVRLCLENGGDPNNDSASGSSPLYLAALSGTREGAKIVKLLLHYGAKLGEKEEARIRKLLGLKKVEELFGLKWDEIVQRIRAGEDLAIRASRKPNVL
ncbi:hypothetical protein F5Y04DRAFT_274777 [Hypomontagnella monticulosa]|nr:hypothetical protein F5Y04DRAFT_274777 [Hypomontagnella monticulosa]